ncbi:hypothetical protein Celaphus_00012778 [Cervus elaphus hippelaphus]|uniref:Uncharacterized protein n=1 Tax=Cervus elaphus hippelaphus TaxID=46360 RepID=A0A212CJ93_CEREH|nr:hypothetical protein Celaphus_00012778 [Cervus elaphus hippelaphus]
MGSRGNLAVTTGAGFATWNWKIYLLGSTISFPVLSCLNKKDPFSWTLIVLSPSRQHSCSDRNFSDRWILYSPNIISSTGDADLQDTVTQVRTE